MLLSRWRTSAGPGRSARCVWPFNRKVEDREAEKRESGGDFSDAVVRLIEAQASGTAADASSTAAIEAAAGALSQSLC